MKALSILLTLIIIEFNGYSNGKKAQIDICDKEYLLFNSDYKLNVKKCIRPTDHTGQLFVQYKIYIGKKQILYMEYDSMITIKNSSYSIEERIHSIETKFKEVSGMSVEKTQDVYFLDSSVLAKRIDFKDSTMVMLIPVCNREVIIYDMAKQNISLRESILANLKVVFNNPSSRKH